MKEQSAMKLAWKNRALYVLLAPAIVFYVVFCYIPMYGITIAFKDFMLSKGVLASPWVGFDHFQTLFALDKFWSVFYNTFYINLLKIVWGFPAPLILALLLNEVRRMVFKRTVQTIIYLPYFISWVTIAGIVTAFLSVEDGLVNKIILSFGGEKVNFLMRSDLFRPLLVVTSIWKEAGWGTIIYFAAISSVPPELYEAAKIDGANRWKQTFHVTLPGMMPIIVLMVTLSLGNVLNAGFDQVFNLANPLVYESGDILDTMIYRIAFNDAQYGVATAVGLFKSVVSFLLISISYWLAYRLANYRIF